ncbi:MAG: phage virion morphogenesis protein [Pusillimonas sp.]
MTNIELTLDDKNIRALLNALSKRCEDTSGVMNKIAEEMRKSVDENFEVGGRYSSPDSMIGGKKKWKPLSRATKAIKKRQGKKGPYQILVDSEQLVGSISTKYSKDFAEVGTNKEYAAAQHFGRPAGVEALIGAHIRHVKGRGQTFGKRGKLGKEKTLKRGVSVRAHMRKMPAIPARPFMTIHPESIEVIKNTLLDYLLKPAF